MPMVSRRVRSRHRGAIVVAVILALPVVWTIAAFTTMLGFGILHTYVPQVPAIGFPSSFMVALALRLIWPTPARLTKEDT